jgi:hypothetical protein
VYNGAGNSRSVGLGSAYSRNKEEKIAKADKKKKNLASLPTCSTAITKLS